MRAQRKAVDAEKVVWGPAMLALAPIDRAWVVTYCETASAAAAERSFRPSTKLANRVNAHRRLKRKDVAAAVVEEVRRRHAMLLPVHSEILAQIARGEGTEAQGPVPYAVQARAARDLMAIGGLTETVKHEVEHRVEVTLSVPEMFAELLRLGKKPEEVLVNLPADEKRQVLELAKKKDGSFG